MVTLNLTCQLTSSTYNKSLLSQKIFFPNYTRNNDNKEKGIVRIFKYL